MVKRGKRMTYGVLRWVAVGLWWLGRLTGSAGSSSADGIAGEVAVGGDNFVC